MNIYSRLKGLMKDQSGATAIEYALIASLISIIIVGALTSVGSSLNDNFFQNVNDGLN